MAKRGKRGRGGGDPLGAPGGARSRRERIKEAQLCAQVERALSLALADSDHEALLELIVMEVVPAPDASRLLVRLQAPAGRDPDEALTRLEVAAGRLRAEVASAIHRKKTPTLLYQVLPAAVADPDGRADG